MCALADMSGMTHTDLSLVKMSVKSTWSSCVMSAKSQASGARILTVFNCYRIAWRPLFLASHRAGLYNNICNPRTKSMCQCAISQWAMGQSLLVVHVFMYASCKLQRYSSFTHKVLLVRALHRLEPSPTITYFAPSQHYDCSQAQLLNSL